MLRWQRDHAERMGEYQEYLEATGEEPDEWRDRPRSTIEAERILEIWGLLARLHDVVDGGTILKLCGASREDLELLAVVAGEVSSGPSDKDRRA